MTNIETNKPNAVIACGGTGGHLFPGIAVAEQLRQRGCHVTLLISPKEVDQQAVKSAEGMEVVTLPAVGLVSGKLLLFIRGFAESYRASRKLFKVRRPDAVLAMGGFTSAPPVLAASAAGVPTFLHESNTMPGKANRWLSWVVNEAFVGFPDAGNRLHTRKVHVTGTPVRAQFQPTEPGACRAALGLDPNRPVLMVTGGSQGASGLNDMVIAGLPLLARRLPELQLLHLTGPTDAARVGKACAENKMRAVVLPFYSEMHIALGAANAVVSRAGASSLAELAAMRLPSVLVPFPAATDDHQYFNALAFEKTGAARLLPQRESSPETLTAKILELIEDVLVRERMRAALAEWHAPNAAERIAERIMRAIMEKRRGTGKTEAAPTPDVEHRQSIAA